MSAEAPIDAKTPPPLKKKPFIKKRRWRLAVCVVVLAVASVFFQFVIEAPISLPDSFLALPVMFLWQPIFGLPLVAFSVWWILDRRIPWPVLVIIFGLLAFCGRLLVGSPPGMTEEEQRDLEMALGEEEAAIFIERNKPAEYKRKWFPPY